MRARVEFMRLGPFAASCGLHVVLVGLAATVVPGWVAPLPPVLEAQFIEPEPAPAAPARPAPPAVRPAPPAPTTLPRLVEAPRPRIEEPKVVEPPSVPAPAPPLPPAPPPTATRETLPFAVAASEPASAPAELPAAVGRPPTPAAAPAPPPAVAKAPLDEDITRMAAPTGGYQVRPSYPSTARRLGVEGTTLLRVYVAADGRVTDVQLDQTAGHPDLDRAAAEAVRRWKFEPGRRGSEPIGMWVRLPVQFVLK
jgi:protein TonB